MTNDSQFEIEALLEENPKASAYYATAELHEGRIDWLAEHIRACNFQIDPVVAKKLLEMIEGTDPDCFFEIQIRRRKGLPPRALSKKSLAWRDLSWAIAVARNCSFKHATLARACHKVGKDDGGFEGVYVAKRIRRWKGVALEIVAEERMEAAYLEGKMDFLGRPKSP